MMYFKPAFLKTNILLFFLIAGGTLYSQNIHLHWTLKENGLGVSDNEMLKAGEFVFGSGLTNPKFGSSGAYAKSWSLTEKDSADYFMVSCVSNSKDTLVLKQLSFQERRSNTSIRAMEVLAQINQHPPLLFLKQELPDNDKERSYNIGADTCRLFLPPKDTLKLYFYGYQAEKASGTWRIGDNSLKINLDVWVRDTIPPQINDLTIINDSLIELRFSEPINWQLLNKANFKTEPNLAIKELYKSHSDSSSVVHIRLQSKIQNRVSYHLFYQNIYDLEGNVFSDWQSIPFSENHLEAFDILITEVMNKPSPKVYLPENEYLECYNNYSDSINLEGAYLKINSKKYHFPQLKIAPKTYFLIAKEECIDLYPDIIVIPLFTLKNHLAEHFQATIYNNQDEWIFQIDFNSEYFQTDDKKEGGWSSEMIDMNTPCDMVHNWTSSINRKGGTPGLSNSVTAENTAPTLQLKNAYLKDNHSAKLIFNQYFEHHFHHLTHLFSIHKQTPDSIAYSKGAYSVDLYFSKPFTPNVVYTLEIDEHLKSCETPITKKNQHQKIGLAIKANPNDLCINEMLFDTDDLTASYIEIYNLSDNIIDLQEFRLSQLSDEKEKTSDYLFQSPILIYPKEYRAISSDSSKVIDYFQTINASAVLESPHYLKFSSKNSYIKLIDRSYQVIDEAFYSEEIHSPFLNNTQNVSVEKIRPDLKGTRLSSWQSSASSVHYGTPAYRNAQYLEIPNSTTQITLESSSFSPDQDGYEDFLSINYHILEKDCLANVYCFDLSGHKICTLANNELLGQTGQWIWDGRKEDGTPANYGQYIILIGLSYSNGEQEIIKKVCSLNVKR